METRSSPSMGQLRALAAERGLKYFRHLSKPELFALLNRKEGGGTAAAKTTPTVTMPAAGLRENVSAHANVDKPQSAGHDAATKNPKACSKATRSSERISKRKRDASVAEDAHEDAETADSCKKAKKSAINTLDPIMLTELGPNTVRALLLQSAGARGVLNSLSVIPCCSLSLCARTGQSYCTMWTRSSSIFWPRATSPSRKRASHSLRRTFAAWI